VPHHLRGRHYGGSGAAQADTIENEHVKRVFHGAFGRLVMEAALRHLSEVPPAIHDAASRAGRADDMTAVVVRGRGPWLVMKATASPSLVA
jgi:hypothetical protein